MPLQPFTATPKHTQGAEHMLNQLNRFRFQCATEIPREIDELCDRLAQDCFESLRGSLRMSLESGRRHHQYKPIRFLLQSEFPQDEIWPPGAEKRAKDAKQMKNFYRFSDEELDQLAGIRFPPEHQRWLRSIYDDITATRSNYMRQRIHKGIKDLFHTARQDRSIHKDLAYSVKEGAFPHGSIIVTADAWIKKKGFSRLKSFLSYHCWGCDEK
jgi:predicted DNA-binding protein